MPTKISGVQQPIAVPRYPYVDPGALRHQIQLQAQSTVQAADGAPSTAWTTILTTFAAISTKSSREVYQAQQFTSLVTHLVTVRWPGASIAVAEGQRVLFGARVFTVQGVENVEERNRVLRLTCVEIDGGD